MCRMKECTKNAQIIQKPLFGQLSSVLYFTYLFEIEHLASYYIHNLSLKTKSSFQLVCFLIYYWFALE